MIEVESRNNNSFNRSSKIERVIHNKQVKRLIANYVENIIQPFTCTDIKEHLMMKTGISSIKQMPEKILRDKLRFSFKRCSARLLLLNYKLAKVKKVLLSIKVLKIIRESTLLVNVDEANFYHSAKTNYSWSKIGAPANLSTIFLRGSISVVSVILMDGISITWMKSETINSDWFIEFMNNLLRIWERLLVMKRDNYVSS